MKREDYAYAGGLFEGEGCITLLRTKPPPGSQRSGQIQLRLQLNMTDEEPVRRFAEVVGVGAVMWKHSPSVKGRGRKPQWLWRTWTFEQGQAVIAMLWPWLGPRRRARAVEALGLIPLPVSDSEKARRAYAARRVYAALREDHRSTL